uniref:SET domain-containing protein n=1 Tax=Eutreptiella gymnastica TaxID=73025 RepID=A0A7S1NQD4_9EUGL|mmetsp:Transcript_72078/g.127025  ORF Transcript_72078/g.127025 Transcript_72078/m.127025 type:complete len:568 (+) Transcript_72078:116-1819(+)
MNTHILFFLLLSMDVLGAPITNTIVDTIISKCPKNIVPNEFCVAHIEALLALEHISGKSPPREILMDALMAVRNAYVDDGHIHLALAASQRFAQLVPEHSLIGEENANHLLWLERASPFSSKGEGALPKLHECPTQTMCTILINAARLNQHLRMGGGRCLMHPAFIEGGPGMGLVVARDVAPGETLIVMPQTLALRHASDEGLGENASWAKDLDRVERFAVRLLMMLDNSEWKAWQDLLTSRWLGDTPSDLDLPHSWTTEQIELLRHVNPFAAAWATSHVTGWTATFNEVESSLKKILREELVTLEHWLWACGYGTSRATDDAIVPYVELMNHSPDGETLLVSPFGEHWMRATKHYKKGEQVFFQYFRPPAEVVFSLMTWGLVPTDFSREASFQWHFGMIGSASTWPRVAQALEKHDWQWRVVVIGNGTGLLQICRALYMEEEDMEHIDKLLLGEEVSPRNELMAIREEYEQLRHLQQSLEKALPMLEAATPSPQLDTIRQLHYVQQEIISVALSSASLKYTLSYWTARQEVNTTKYSYIPPRIVPTPSYKDTKIWHQYRSRYVYVA